MEMMQVVLFMLWVLVAVYGSRLAEDDGGQSAGTKFFLKWTVLCILIFLGTILIQL